MISRSFSATVSVLALAFGTAAFAGCAATSTTPAADDSEATLQSAEALSSESTATDPVEDAVTTDDDADAAAAEASEQDDAPAPLDIGCGFRMTLRERILKHFDKDGDGKLDQGEREALKDAIGPHPKLKLELVAIGVKARQHVLKRIEWAYDVDNSGDLDATERAALAAAVKVRCEERKERALAKFDANGDGKLDDGELRDALKDRLLARIAKVKEILGKFDANGDGKLDDGERAAAKAALRAHYLAKREEVKAKFDTNGDGKLDDGEIAALKAAIRARFESEAPGE
jgi:Ca2+-binding EF-hand superfamily protein